MVDGLAGGSLTCAECGATADADAAGWRAHLVDPTDEGEPLEVVVLSARTAPSSSSARPETIV
jgi:hypothetical protein